MNRPSIVEAQERLAKIPTIRATFIGFAMGIVVSLIAQLFLKPISIDQPPGEKFTIRAGSQVIWSNVAPGDYYFWVGVLLVAALFLSWYLQKRLTVGAGFTLDRIDHGVGKDRIDTFVEQLDESLKKLTKHGIMMQELPTKGDTYIRGFRPSDEDENSITAKVQPFLATVEAPINDFRSLEAAREVIKCIREIPSVKSAELSGVKTF